MHLATTITIFIAVYVFTVTNIFLKRASQHAKYTGVKNDFFQHEGFSICDFGVWMGILVTLLLALQAYVIETNYDKSDLTPILTGVMVLLSFWMLILAAVMNYGVFLLMIPAGIAQIVVITQLKWKT